MALIPADAIQGEKKAVIQKENPGLEVEEMPLEKMASLEEESNKEDIQISHLGDF